MLGITNIWAYLLGTIAIILLPGPNSMYVLSVAARRGVRAGYAGAAGVFLGDAALMTMSAAGVASLLRAQPALFQAVKYAGAGYLCWIGANLVRRAWSTRTPTRDTPAAPLGDTPPGAVPPAGPADTRSAPEPVGARERNPFRRALAVSLLNPKAILFFVSFFIQFVRPGYPHAWLSFLVLGTIVEICSAAYLTTLIFTGSYLAAALRRRRRLSRVLTTGIGAVFLGFAVKLATASLT